MFEVWNCEIESKIHDLNVQCFIKWKGIKWKTLFQKEMKRVVEIFWVLIGFFWTQIYYNFFDVEDGIEDEEKEEEKEEKKKEIQFFIYLFF